MNDYCDLIQTLDHYVSPQRKSHILSVRETAARILWDQGLDDLLEKAQIAALLHDITKEFSLPLQLEIIKKYNLPLTDEDLETPATLHAFTGAAVAKDIYPDLVDDAVYQAIFSHCTGKANMTNLDKIIFLADYIEPGRSYKPCVEVRTYYEAHKIDPCVLDQCVFFTLRETICYLEKNNKKVNPRTRQAINDYKQKDMNYGKSIDA